MVIPTYNRGSLLRKAVQSVLQQTCPVLEIIIVDDGSADDTAAVVERLREQSGIPDRILYIFQQNRGKSAALNAGLRLVHGKWIAFLDSDDQWLPTKLESQMYALQECRPHCEACFTDSQYINNPQLQTTAFQRAGMVLNDERGVITDRARYIASPYGIFMQTLLVEAHTMRNVGGFAEDLRIRQDIDIIFRIFLETPLCYVNKPLVLIDRTPNRSEGLIETWTEKNERDFSAQQRMYEKWLRLSETLGRDAQDNARKRLAGFHSTRANWHLKNRHYREARRAIADAIHVKWTPPLIAKWILAAAVPPIARSIVLKRLRQGKDQELPRIMQGGSKPTEVPEESR